MGSEDRPFPTMSGHESRIASYLPTGLPPSLPNATIWCSMTPANPQLSTAARPRVGIPWRTSHEEAKGNTSKLQYYFAAVTAAEGEPVPVSLQLSPNELAAQIRNLDAFVLPGAPADVNPALYRSARHPKTHDIDSDREKTDFAILEHAFASGKPVLAICYGCQSLNVCLGGSLYQDIASELHTSIEHSREGLPPDAVDPFHPARIEPGGEIAQLAAISGPPNQTGGFDVQINTSHHQSVRDLGDGLRVAALAPDGVIEAVEHEPHKHWVIGVQWHPERMKGDALASALFRALLQATRAAAAHR
jgi:putative glutamine amidotransferase